MKPWAVHVADAADDADAVSLLIARLERAWGHTRPVRFCPVAMSDLQQAGCDAVVIRITEPDQIMPVTEAAYGLEESGIGVLAITAETIPTLGGALVTPESSSDDRIAARLVGLLHRHGEVHRLRQDLAIARRTHGGMQGEMSRMHDELQFAAQVQRDFLPCRLPELHGVRFGALWRPANYVSGDVYGATQLDEDHIGFFIADCVGHGVPAALMTMIICRAIAMDDDQGDERVILEPSHVLERLNEAMLMRAGSATRFATAMCGLVNCRTRTLKIAGAGHPPALLLRGDAAPIEIESEGGLLGVFAQMEFPQSEVQLQDSDRLVLHTDGFEQAFPSEEGDARLPTDRYLNEFAALADAENPQSMIERVATRLDEERGSLHQIDDLTMLCMLVDAEAAEAGLPAAAAA